MLPRDVLLLDVETTGLDPTRDSIIQLAAVHLDHRDLEERASFAMLARPESEMSAAAAAIHGWSEDRLAGAARIETVIGRFDAFAPDHAILCGHNVGFDVGFLRAAYKGVGLKYPFDYHLIDVWSVAFFVLGAAGVHLESYNLNSLCSYFGIDRPQRHDALQDVRASAKILRYLLAVVELANPEVRGQLNLFGES